MQRSNGQSKATISFPTVAIPMLIGLAILRQERRLKEWFAKVIPSYRYLLATVNKTLLLSILLIILKTKIC